MSRFRLMRVTDRAPVQTPEGDGWFDIDQPVIGDIIKVTDCRQYEIVSIENMRINVRVF